MCLKLLIIIDNIIGIIGLISISIWYLIYYSIVLTSSVVCTSAGGIIVSVHVAASRRIAVDREVNP